MLKTILEVFVSVFFVFGLYCAATEIGKLIIKAIRYRTNKIDKNEDKGYNIEEQDNKTDLNDTDNSTQQQ